MGKFAIKTSSNAQYYFSLIANNGQKILASEAYTTKASCINGIESVRVNSQDYGKYEKLNSSNGKYYFNLKASNGQTIGTSEMYETSASRDGGIEAVKVAAPSAVVVEE